jgi:ribonuclease HI
MMTYDVYIDGSWSPQRQRGGWAAIILSPDGIRAEFSGPVFDTTPQGAEIHAAVEALAHLGHEIEHVRLYSDNSVLVTGVNQHLATWRNRDWQTVKGRKLAHHDLWAKLDRQLRERGDAVTVSWVAGDGHNALHARAHALAITAMRGTTAPVPPSEQVDTAPVEDVSVTESNARMRTCQGIAVDRSVVEAFAAALVAADKAECLAPSLATQSGRVRVRLDGAMGTVELQRDGQAPLTETEAVQAALMLLAGAHAVRMIAAHDTLPADPD